jgi:hypothetical protein
MQRRFSYTISGDPDQYLAKAEKSAAEAGADFSGDASSGRFSARGVHGRYSVSGKTVEVMIEKRPSLAPWGIVESALDKFFA